ncbi:MAG: DMT family transporter [Pseudomonadota bacterium]
MTTLRTATVIGNCRSRRVSVGLFGSRLGLYLLLLFAGVIWGATFSLALIATREGLHPIALTFSQALVGALILLSVCAAKHKLPSCSAENLKRYVVIAVLGTVLPGTLYFYAARHVPAGLLSITIAAVPILTYAASLLFNIDRWYLARVAGLVFGFSGMYLLAQPETLPDIGMLPWIGVAFFCTLCYTTENMYIELRLPMSIDMLPLLAGGLTVAAMLSFPIMIVVAEPTFIAPPFDHLDAILLALGLIGAVAYLIFLYLIRAAGAVFASMMAYVITLSGVGWGMLLFDEQHSTQVWMVLVLMITGMFLVTPNRQSGPEVNDPDPDRED